MLLQDAMYIGSIEVVVTYTLVLNFYTLVSSCVLIHPSSKFPSKRGGELLLESLMLVFMAIAHFAAISCRRNPLAYRLRRVEGVGVPSFALIGEHLCL